VSFIAFSCAASLRQICKSVTRNADQSNCKLVFCYPSVTHLQISTLLKAMYICKSAIHSSIVVVCLSKLSHISVSRLQLWVKFANRWHMCRSVSNLQSPSDTFCKSVTHLQIQWHIRQSLAYNTKQTVSCIRISVSRFASQICKSTHVQIGVKFAVSDTFKVGDTLLIEHICKSVTFIQSLRRITQKKLCLTLAYQCHVCSSESNLQNPVTHVCRSVSEFTRLVTHFDQWLANQWHKSIVVV
jgi:hypothetical protein